MYLASASFIVVCDSKTTSKQIMMKQQQQETTTTTIMTCWRARLASLVFTALLIAIVAQGDGQHAGNVIIEQQSVFSGAQLLPTGHSGSGGGVTSDHQLAGARHVIVGGHFQPSHVLAVRNKLAANFSHLAIDEARQHVYLGATNWLLQVSLASLAPEQAIKTGPALESLRSDCAPSDCPTQLAQVDLQSLAWLYHAHGPNLSVPAASISNGQQLQLQQRGRTMHQQLSAKQQVVAAAAGKATTTSPSLTAASAVSSATAPSASLQVHTNNYNKILAIDGESGQLIVCGSLNQGACRLHQLGQVSNFSELIPLPVASNDAESSSVGLVVQSQALGASGSGAPSSSSGNKRRQQQQQQASSQPMMYVAATNSHLGPYREMVPAISGRYLEPSSRAMQIIERSFTDSARIDISFELRDYYLVNYVGAFAHSDFVYFGTVQRKSPLRQLEESGYTSRLARLCQSDLSFQSYIELSLECKLGSTHYNLLQDLHLMPASSHLAQQLGLKQQQQQPSVLVGAFSQSRDHTTRSQNKSAICLFPMERVELAFNENIQLCYNGSSKARNMNYIAGSVNDCPKPTRISPQMQSPSSQRVPASAGQACSEPIKLNGSLALVARPVATFERDLVTALASLQAPTSPLSAPSGAHNQNHHQNQNQQHQQQQNFIHNQNNQLAGKASQRQHQVLLAGTSEGQLKRLALLSTPSGSIRGHELDSVWLDPDRQEPILADLFVLQPDRQQHQQAEAWPAFAVAATPSRVIKLRVNGCRASARSQTGGNASSSHLVESCQACAHLQDPFCGWCSSSGACTSRHECAAAAASTAATTSLAAAAKQPAALQWTPFDQIRCADYQSVWPRYVALQLGTAAQLQGTERVQPVEVNVRLERPQAQQQVQQQQQQDAWAAQLAAQLAQAQFNCHFDYLAHANRSWLHQLRLAGSTTKATQARLNLHAGTVSIGCPLPIQGQRPSSNGHQDELRTRLTVSLAPSSSYSSPSGAGQRPLGELSLLQQALGLQPAAPATANQVARADLSSELAVIERQLSFYDCSVHTSCRTCLASGADKRRWSCAWCPLSNRCTFNASHLEFGCAASAVSAGSSASSSTTTPGWLNAWQLASSLDEAQANVFGLSVERPAKCLGEPESATAAATVPTTTASLPAPSGGQQANEILIASNSRRQVQIQLRQPLSQLVQGQKRASSPIKVECLIEIENAKARLAAKLADAGQLIVCQESTFTYQEEIATLRAQVHVIVNENQLIETSQVILHKCNLFGVNPPALTSTVGAAGSGKQYSSAAWRAHELLQWTNESQSELASSNAGWSHQLAASGGLLRRQVDSATSSDCSLCANIERKYQCTWCQASCLHADQCQDLPAASCPPPQIHSLHPASGPVEGGTLLTIEGTNLGANEREIQDKITVGGEPCKLVLYSVSKRIVCQTAPSARSSQPATVFVGNRAGVTSALFHYKPVFLSDVSPRLGPVSGGTRLYLSGTNLDIGSRTQVYLDDIPCAIDSSRDITSNQIICVTGPNLQASNLRIQKLILIIDNSTQHLHYPFSYQPDPIISNIDPTESFLSGGRLILISGQHLSSPQTTRLIVFHEHRPTIINATSCNYQNDTLVTCLTPAISRQLLISSLIQGQQQQTSSSEQHQSLISDDDAEQLLDQQLSYEMGGLKLKMSLFMDDVKSVRNLDEYYHHLPHYMTYYLDPVLFRLQQQVVDYASLLDSTGTNAELTIRGENLKMRQLDQDILITVGNLVCPIKSLTRQQVVCEPPKRIAPIYRDSNGGQLVDQPVLPIVALIGANIRTHLGHIQYASSQYQFSPPLGSVVGSNGDQQQQQVDGHETTTSNSQQTAASYQQTGVQVLLSLLSLAAILVGVAISTVFGLAKFKQSKAEREYKRIQLQMGALEAAGSLFDNNQTTNSRHWSYMNTIVAGQRNYGGASVASPSGKQQQKLLYHLPMGPQFAPASPQAGDLASLAGLPSHAHLQQQQQQHFVKLASNGSTVTSSSQPLPLIGAAGCQQNYNMSSTASSSSSPNSNNRLTSLATTTATIATTTTERSNLLMGSNNSTSSTSSSSASGGQRHAESVHLQLQHHHHQQQQQHQNQPSSWTQDAPSTVLPYAVIEACKLDTLDARQGRKYV